MHKYAVQLIRIKLESNFRRREEIALEKIADTFGQACEIAFQFGAKPRKSKSDLAKIENTRATYPCRDKRFARVQIVPVKN